MDNKNFNEENVLHNAQPLSDEKIEQVAGGYPDYFDDDLGARPVKYRGQCRYCGQAFEADTEAALVDALFQHEIRCLQGLPPVVLH